MANVGVVNTVSRSANPRVTLQECVLPIPDGMYSPNDLTKTLRCVDGIRNLANADTPHRAEWRPFGRLYESGFCQRIKIKFFAYNAAGTALSFTEPSEFAIGSPQTFQVYANHDKNVITFDDTAVTNNPYTTNSPINGITTGGSTAITVTFELEGESLAIQLDTGTAELIEEDLNDSSTGLAKVYRVRRRFVNNPTFFAEFVWEIPTQITPAPALGYEENRGMRFWAKIGNSYADAPTGQYPSVRFTLTQPVKFKIEQSGDLVDSRIYYEERVVSSWDSGPTETNHEWTLINPVSNPTTTGESYNRFPDGTTFRFRGEMYALASRPTVGGTNPTIYDAFKEGVPVTSIGRDAFPSGHARAGQPYGTWGIANYTPLWLPSGGGSAKGWCPAYSNETEAYAGWSYVYENEVYAPQTSGSKNYDRDPFATPLWNDGRHEIGRPSGNPSFGIQKLWPLVNTGSPTYDAYMVDAYRAGLRPCHWHNGDGSPWSHADRNPTSGLGSDLTRNKTDVLLWESRPNPNVAPGGFTFGKTGNASELEIPSSERLAGRTGREGSGRWTYSGYDKNHISSTFLLDLYRLTGDYHLRELVENLGQVAVAHNLPWSPLTSSNSYNIIYRDHYVSGMESRGIGRTWQMIAAVYEVTGDPFYMEMLHDRWNTVERGTFAGQRTGWAGQPNPGVAHNREFPNFLLGEAESATNPIRNYVNAQTVIAPIQSANTYAGGGCQATWSGEFGIVGGGPGAQSSHYAGLNSGTANSCGFIANRNPWNEALCVYGFVAAYRMMFRYYYNSADISMLVAALEAEWLAKKVAKANTMYCYWFNAETGRYEVAIVGPPVYPYTNDTNQPNQPLLPEHINPFARSNSSVANGFYYMAFDGGGISDPAQISSSYKPYMAMGDQLGHFWSQQVIQADGSTAIDEAWHHKCWQVLDTNMVGLGGTKNDEYIPPGSYGWSLGGIHDSGGNFMDFCMEPNMFRVRIDRTVDDDTVDMTSNAGFLADDPVYEFGRDVRLGGEGDLDDVDDIAGSLLWSWHWAGASGANLTLDGDQIDQVDDLSGNANHLTGLSSDWNTVDRRAYIRSGVSYSEVQGGPWSTSLDLIGVDRTADNTDRFGNAYEQSSSFGATGEFYLLCVTGNTRDNGFRDLWGSDTDDYVRYAQGIAGNYVAMKIAGGSETQVSTGDLPAGALALEIWRDASNVIHVRANNVDIGNSTTISGTFDFSGFGYRNDASAGTSYHDDYLQEIVNVKGSLTDFQRGRILAAVRERWDLPFETDIRPTVPVLDVSDSSGFMTIIEPGGTTHALKSIAFELQFGIPGGVESFSVSSPIELGDPDKPVEMDVTIESQMTLGDRLWELESTVGLTQETTGSMAVSKSVVADRNYPLEYEAVEERTLETGGRRLRPTVIQVNENSDLVIDFTVKESGVPIDLSDATELVYGVFENRIDGRKIIEKTIGDGISLDNAAVGVVRLTLSADDTVGHSGLKYHEMRVVRPSEKKHLMTGFIQIRGTRLS